MLEDPDEELGEAEELVPPGQVQFRLGEVPPAAELVPPLVVDCVDWLDWLEPVLLDVLPPAAGEELLEGEVAPLLVDGELELPVEGEVAPAAPLEVVPELGEVEPDELPEPLDWLVWAPCVMVDDGLVVVAFWLAEAEPVDTLLSPVPRFTPAPTFAPALTSVLLMPTFASTPTFGLTFTPPDGAVVEVLGCDEELDGCEDWVVCELWVLEDCANADPNAPITAAAVILTAR